MHVSHGARVCLMPESFLNSEGEDAPRLEETLQMYRLKYRCLDVTRQNAGIPKLHDSTMVPRLSSLEIIACCIAFCDGYIHAILWNGVAERRPLSQPHEPEFCRSTLEAPHRAWISLAECNGWERTWHVALNYPSSRSPRLRLSLDN